MKAETFEHILLLGRLAILEQMVVKLDALARIERLQCSTHEALRQTLGAYEEAARVLERGMYQHPDLKHIPSEERGMLADAFRDHFDELKTRATDLFGPSR